MSQSKSFTISRRSVWEAYKRVKAKRGSAGVDGQSIKEFEKNLLGNLYKLWNRLYSGSYMPPAVRRVDIPKSSATVLNAKIMEKRDGRHCTPFCVNAFSQK